jgi:hypothetical protein
MNTKRPSCGGTDLPEGAPPSGMARRKFAGCCGLLFLFACLCASPALADEALPAPQQTGGMGLFEALKKRASAVGGDFSLAEVTREELSTILWAAGGLNRGTSGWTAPMWRGVPPYCRIYVAADDGVSLYDWKEHALEKVAEENIKAAVGRQSFVGKARYVLIFVSDAQSLAQFNSEDITRDFAHVAVGAMTQNVYLTCAALRIGTRYVHAMDAEVIARVLRLPPGDTPIALMPLGK